MPQLSRWRRMQIPVIASGGLASIDDIKALGKSVSLRTQKTFVGTLGSVAAGAGATPWHIFRHGHRIWGRIFDGGDHVLYKAGLKGFPITPETRCPSATTAAPVNVAISIITSGFFELA